MWLGPVIGEYSLTLFSIVDAGLTLKQSTATKLAIGYKISKR